VKRLPQAASWYRKSMDSPLSNPAYEWRVRAALLAGAWPLVRRSIEQMPERLSDDTSWIYSRGRARKESGDTLTANKE
ncbi:lytic transglycosylase domain-containing protein, partial [Burkholderia pseudomallei]